MTFEQLCELGRKHREAERAYHEHKRPSGGFASFEDEVRFDLEENRLVRATGKAREAYAAGIRAYEAAQTAAQVAAE